MLEKYRKNEGFRHMFWITAIYIATHGFLLVATGRWWDDWAYADRNWDYMIGVFMQSSLPLHAVINAGTWLFPAGFYRILTFIYFYVGAILFYKILKKTGLFSSDACFWIVMLYVGIPINDARMAWINYAYSFGLFMFFIAFYTTTVFKESTGWRRIIFRILSLILLMVSFDTESIMMLTLLILGYLYHDDLKEGWNWREVKKNVKKIAGTVIRYPDFLFAPVVWYFGDKMLFPGYGIYGGHSYIGWDTLPLIVLHAPKNALITLANILSSYYHAFSGSAAAVTITAAAMAVYVFAAFRMAKKNPPEDAEEKTTQLLLMLILGVIVYVLGFFPYQVHRDSAIGNTFTRGRDTMLLGMGTAIMLFYGLRLILRRKIAEPIMIALAVLGIVHFNITYLDWQESAYQQFELQREMAENTDLQTDDTFLIMYRGALINANYCQTIGNSWEVLGPGNCFYICGTINMPYIMNDSEHKDWILNNWKMTDYTKGDGVIDGIVFVDYADIDTVTMIRQKWNELFNRNVFNAWLDSEKDIKFVPITPAESDELYEMCKNGSLSDEKIYEMYY